MEEEWPRQEGDFRLRSFIDVESLPNPVTYKRYEEFRPVCFSGVARVTIRGGFVCGIYYVM
jgi:hypothetical protein